MTVSSAPPPPQATIIGPRLGTGLAMCGTALVWLHFSRLPLTVTDLWGHLAYGRWIARHGAVPQFEPLIPAAAASPFVDSVWLTQWIGYQIERFGGVFALQQLFAAVVAVIGVLVCRSASRLSGTTWGGVVGAACWWIAAWSQLQVIRPQILGVLCATLLLQLLVRRAPPRRPPWVMGIVFACWANVHGSFPIGWLLIGCPLVTRTLAQAGAPRETLGGGLVDHLRNLRGDPELRWLARGLGWAVAGTFLNPYGWHLLREVLWFVGRENLADLTEWQPLKLRSPQGQRFLGVAVGVTTLQLLGLIRVWRLPAPGRSIRQWMGTPECGLLLAALILGGATIASARFILWWSLVTGPLAACAAVRLLSGGAPLQSLAHSPRRWARVIPGLSLACVLVCVICSPLGQGVLRWETPPPAQIVSPATPLGIVQHLGDNPPKGLVFLPMEWGDYVLWAGPPGIDVLVASHVHLIPPDVWRDYLVVVRRQTGWRDVLKRHQVSTMILDRRYRRRLIEDVEHDPDWRVEYADDLGVVFSCRRTGESGAPLPPESK